MAAGLVSAPAPVRAPATASTAQAVIAAEPLHALPGDWPRAMLRFLFGLALPLAACAASALLR